VPAELLVDTSAWYPLADPEHPDHPACAGALREQVRSGARIVTTNLLIAESYALLLNRLGRESALAFLTEVRRPPIAVVASSPELEHRAHVDWLEPFDDQDFSLADAVSFAVMAERGIKEALTLDRHFAAAGFRMIPAPASAGSSRRRR
jgi:predicted nucleic acid-binding protein